MTPTSTGQISPERLRTEQARTLASPRRAYGLPARTLFLTMDLVYGREPSIASFRVLEVVARVPYQAWESVAYVAETHTHATPALVRLIHDRVEEARHQQDNELWHLLIIDELLHRHGHRPRTFRDRVLPQVLAFVYYQISWLLYVIRPALSYRLNADFEDHAEHTYMEFVRSRPELDDESWHSVFEADYGDYDSVGDLLRRIALDEREHKESSEAHIADARFAPLGKRKGRP